MNLLNHNSSGKSAEIRISPNISEISIEFKSILFRISDSAVKNGIRVKAPDFFPDLNLDQIVSSVTSGKEEYNLKPFFYSGPVDRDTIIYRQQVMLDLENTALYSLFDEFAGNMRNIRAALQPIDKLYYNYQKDRLYLDVIKLYFETVDKMSREMAFMNLKSEGLINFRGYLENFVQSAPFTELKAEIQQIADELSSVRYCIYIDGLRVQVKHCNGEPDYSAEVESVFSRFKEGVVQSYLSKLPNHETMNDIEAQILDGVASLYPGYFSHLEQFVGRNSDFQDKTIAVFDREIQFYLSWLKFTEKFKAAGLSCCYPLVSAKTKEIHSHSAFDMALADKLIPENKPVVVNDFFLKDKERLLVVSGPNQGGKTTFARTFGQLHYLAALGCPVAGTDAQLFMYDRLFTHFEKEENMKNLRGKLQDELVRIHEILKKATTNSLIIINEIFTSTTLQDQVFLSSEIMDKLTRLDIPGVWVTFIDELARHSEQTVSMVSSVVPENTAQRTFKITRRPADGLAYALSVAEKYRLTHTLLTKRLKR